MPDSESVASSILGEAAKIVAGDRNTAHGDKERSFYGIAALWNAYDRCRDDARDAKGSILEGDYAADVSWKMVLLKMARSLYGAPRRDHFVDAAGYAGIAGELVCDIDLAQKATPTVGVSWTEPPVSAPFSFWYLATPYAKFPGGHQAAFHLAVRLASRLMQLEVSVFSPIVHSHTVATLGSASLPTAHEFWMKADRPFMDAAGGLIVAMAESWEESRGMVEEIETFRGARKPIIYWDPAVRTPIEELRRYERGEYQRGSAQNGEN